MMRHYNRDQLNGDQLFRLEEIAECRRAIRYARKHCRTPEDFRRFRNCLAGQVIDQRYKRDYPEAASNRIGWVELKGGPANGEIVHFPSGMPDAWRVIVKKDGGRLTSDIFWNSRYLEIETATYYRKVSRYAKAWRITETVEYVYEP